MKRRLILLAFMVLAVVALHAQHTDCDGKQSCGGSHECCKQFVLTGDEAVAWAQEHVGELVENYLAGAGNKLDPDELRKQLAPIGYDGTNVPDYRKAEKWLVDTVYRRMMQTAVAQGKHNIVMLTGPGGSGKSTSTRSMDLSSYGLVYDSAFNSYSSLKKAIDKALAGGMTDIKVIAVYNDIVTCFKNSVKRGKATNRFLEIGYLVEAFRSNAHKVEMLRLEYPDIEIVAVDNNHNNGGRRVSVEEAEQWDFTVSAETLNHMLTYTLYELYEGELKGNQAAAVAGGVQTVEGLDDTGKALAEEIARRVHPRAE